MVSNVLEERNAFLFFHFENACCVTAHVLSRNENLKAFAMLRKVRDVNKDEISFCAAKVVKSEEKRG